MKKPVIIFDFDGTLVDTFEYFLTIGNKMAREFKFNGIAHHEIDAFKNMTIRQVIRELGVPVLKIPRMLVHGYKEMNDRIQEVRVIDGVGEVLLQLRAQKVQLGLVSTNTKENISAVLKNCDLEDVFDFIYVGSGMLGKPRALRKAMKQHALDIDQVLYVADEVRDIEASRRVGISIASVTWGYNSAEILQAYEPDYLIDHPQELLQMLHK